ncbi:hypothetical protein OH492_11475 [Vibrio chagasii]|nr:hypothetical protein [Vibrio chagasii]
MSCPNHAKPNCQPSKSERQQVPCARDLVDIPAEFGDKVKLGYSHCLLTHNRCAVNTLAMSKTVLTLPHASRHEESPMQRHFWGAYMAYPGLS